MSDREFNALREFVHRESGISLSVGKRQLLTSRLIRRIRHLGYSSFAEYLEHLESRDPKGEERQRMVNSITTNKTEFFRESHHFELLRDVACPAWRARFHQKGISTVRIWSAGCSTGMEPYSIAIVLLEYLAAANIKIEILASDIDTDVLAKAERGVYTLEEVRTVPPAWLPRYFLRGTGSKAGKVQVKKDVRNCITFRQVNLCDPAWDVPRGLDAIFCRNVVIYFDRPTQQRLFDRYADHLVPEGLLFIGHAESLHGITDRFAPLGNTAYRLATAIVPSGGSAVALTGSTHKNMISIVAGEVYASREPAIVQTLLGSCVAACLYDPVTGIGGMNHFLLPGTHDGTEVCERYGADAIQTLINRIVALGGDRRRLKAKLFGAGNVMPSVSLRPTVGDQNAAFTLNYLAVEGIPVVKQLLGCTHGLRVYFETDTGRAWVKPLAETQSEAVITEEARFAKQTTIERE